MMSDEMTVLVTAVAAWETAKLAVAKAEADASFASNEAASAWQETHFRADATQAAQDAVWQAEGGRGVQTVEVAAAALRAAQEQEDKAWKAYYDKAARNTSAQDVLEIAQAAEVAAARAVAKAATALVRTAPCGRQETHESGACECHGYNP